MNNQPSNKHRITNYHPILRIAMLISQIIVTVLLLCPVISVLPNGNTNIFQCLLSNEQINSQNYTNLCICATILIISAIIILFLTAAEVPCKRLHFSLSFFANLATTACILNTYYLFNKYLKVLLKVNEFGIILLVVSFISTLLSVYLLAVPAKSEL